MKKILLIGLILMSLTIKIKAQTKPHIVLYLADDLTYDDLGVNGAKIVRTPNLDEFANKGIIFNKAFIASPACAPSRAALLTGLMPARNGAVVNHTYPKAGTPVLITKLKEAGYKVLAFGKVAHDEMNNHADFDFYHSQKVNLFKNVKSVLDTININSPICLLVGDRRPHVKWTTENIYRLDEIDLPSYLIDTKETREHRGRYYSDITGLDMEFGNIMQYAEKKLGNNVVKLFSSDHGSQWPFGKWNLYEAGIHVPLLVQWKGQIEEGISTNAMVSWIDIFPTLLEIAGVKLPSGLDGKSFIEVLSKPEKEFRKLIFTTHTGDANMNIYPIRSVRSLRYKYILNLLPNCYHTNHSDRLRKDGAGAYWDSWDKKAETDPDAKKIIAKYYVRPAEEFYDLQIDPTEQNNLINDSSLKKYIVQMKRELQKWMKEQEDTQIPHMEPYLINKPLPELSNN